MPHDPLHFSAADATAPRHSGRATWRDLAWVFFLTAATAVLCIRGNTSEWLYGWTRRTESVQLDELPITLLVLAGGLAWFAWRRYGEARRELARRRMLEDETQRLLADNRRLVSQSAQAQEHERRCLARELHDEMGQYLNAIVLDAARIRDLSAMHALEVHRLALGLLQNASHVYRQIGDMARRLRPIGLDELGLPGALEHCVDGWRERLPNAEFALNIDGDFSGLSDVQDITLYRLVQEGLTNVSKFAPTSHVEILLSRTSSTSDQEAGEITVAMTDDGPGIDLAATRNGLGLVGMRERVEALGGEFRIVSEPAHGFMFCARIPVRAQSKASPPSSLSTDHTPPAHQGGALT